MQITDEQLIQEYLEKKRSGITINKECFFMPVRITGMDKTTRIDKKATTEAIKTKYPDAIEGSWEELLKWAEDNNKDLSDLFQEHIVDRPKEEFAKLDLYNGLPILKEHPENREMLNYTNLKSNPIIGSIVKPYFEGEEIWGIAKIYDLSLLDDLEKLQSTSPAVVSILDYPDEKDEKNSIIQEYPVHFNHLAFVKKGHWDQVSNKAYDANDITLNIDKEDTVVEEKVEEKVKALEENEKAEGEKFEELANEHKNLDAKENPILDEGDDQTMMTEKIEEKIKDSEEEIKDSEEEIKDSEEEIEDSEEEIEDSEEEIEDSEEEIKDEAENNLDEERAALIAHFRDAKERSHPALGVRMPYISKRENPSAVISKILKLNTHLFNPKFDVAIDSKFDKAKYELQIDAFNDLLENIEIETANEYKKAGKARNSGFVPTANQRIQVDKNF